jgi:hypothetical protein
MANTVWRFTNGKELNKSEFINYFERKVFRTIRKYSLLPQNKIFLLPDDKSLNTQALKHILQKKFQVKMLPATGYRLPATSTKCLSDEAETIFKKITKGKFNYIPKPSPLLGLMDEEIEL